MLPDELAGETVGLKKSSQMPTQLSDPEAAAPSTTSRSLFMEVSDTPQYSAQNDKALHGSSESLETPVPLE